MGAYREHNSNNAGGLTNGGCPEFETLSAYFDNELADTESALVRAHLNACPRCTETIADFGLLRGALRWTSPGTPNVSLEVNTPADVMPVPASPRTPAVFPLYPVVTAIAAVMIIALIAGHFFSDGEPDSVAAPTVSGAVVMIDGTPYTDEDNDAVFGAASANVMNDEQDAGQEQIVAASSDDSFINRWSATLIVTTMVFAFFGAFWAKSWHSQHG